MVDWVAGSCREDGDTGETKGGIYSSFQYDKIYLTCHWFDEPCASCSPSHLYQDGDFNGLAARQE